MIGYFVAGVVAIVPPGSTDSFNEIEVEILINDVSFRMDVS